MFRVRIVTGDAKGEYFTGFVRGGGGNMAIRANPDVAVAAVFDIPHTISAILALMDVYEVVGVPELTVDTTEAQCVELAADLNQQLFQHPSGRMRDTIRNTFREKADDPILPVPAAAEYTDGFMSVFRWLTIALNANGWSQAERPPKKQVGRLRKFLRWFAQWRKGG